VSTERSSARPLTDVQRRRGIACVLASMGVIGVNVGLFHPLISLNLEARGVTTTVIGLNAAVPFVAAILAAPFLPRLVARVGLIGVLLSAGAIDVLAILGFLLTDDLVAWFVLRFLMGIGMMLHWVGSEIWINAAVRDEHRGKIIGLNGALFSGGMACGPIVLGTVGTQGTLPFVISMAIVAASSVPFLLALGTAPEAHHKGAADLWTACRRAPTAMLSGLAQGVLVMALFVQLPIYGLRSGLGEATAVTLLSALVIGGSVLPIPLGWLADRMNRRLLLILCGAATLLCALALPLAAGDKALLWVVLLAWGGAGGGLYTLALVRIGELTPAGELSAATAAFVMVTHIGSIAGPILLGGGMDLWDPHGFVVVTAGAALLFVAFGTLRYALVPDARRRQGQGSERGPVSP